MCVHVCVVVCVVHVCECVYLYFSASEGDELEAFSLGAQPPLHVVSHLYTLAMFRYFLFHAGTVLHVCVLQSCAQIYPVARHCFLFVLSRHFHCFALATSSNIIMVLYPRVPKFWTHRTIHYCFCNRSVREKAWRSRKRVTQAT